ncbi:Uncharacterized protein HZ326_2086 [Fusarium oxysporum f. sp. albedinis]|nr:Uncharacterized protein HZ326_2086 [Fusarium oxysporum f. sp. albedinis]
MTQSIPAVICKTTQPSLSEEAEKRLKTPDNDSSSSSGSTPADSVLGLPLTPEVKLARVLKESPSLVSIHKRMISMFQNLSI